MLDMANNNSSLGLLSPSFDYNAYNSKGEAVMVLSEEMGFVAEEWIVARQVGIDILTEMNIDSRNYYKEKYPELDLPLEEPRQAFIAKNGVSNEKLHTESLTELLNNAKDIYRLEFETSQPESRFNTIEYYNQLGKLSYILKCDFAFNANQLACIKVMYDNLGTALHQSYIIEQAGINNSELKEVFRNHPAWSTIIVPSQKGHYRLVEPCLNSIIDNAIEKGKRKKITFPFPSHLYPGAFCILVTKKTAQCCLVTKLLF